MRMQCCCRSLQRAGCGRSPIILVVRIQHKVATNITFLSGTDQDITPKDLTPVVWSLCMHRRQTKFVAQTFVCSVESVGMCVRACVCVRAFAYNSGWRQRAERVQTLAGRENHGYWSQMEKWHWKEAGGVGCSTWRVGVCVSVRPCERSCFAMCHPQAASSLIETSRVLAQLRQYGRPISFDWSRESFEMLTASPCAAPKLKYLGEGCRGTSSSC